MTIGATIPDRIVREKERCSITGVSRTGWWRLERSGEAPPRVRIGTSSSKTSSVGWRLSSLMEWVQSREKVIHDGATNGTSNARTMETYAE